MSASFYLNENDYPLHAGTIQLNGLDSAGVMTAPIITSSNVLCPNVYVERAQFCDTAGNIAVPSGPFTITNAPFVDYVLTAVTATTAEWAELPAQDPATALRTDTTVVNIGGSDAPAAGQILIATSDSSAEWGPVPTGNITSNIFSILNNPQLGYVLTGIDSGNVEWAAPTGGSGNITSNVLTILNDPQAGWILEGVTSNTAQWAATVIGNSDVYVNATQQGLMYYTGVAANVDGYQELKTSDILIANLDANVLDVGGNVLLNQYSILDAQLVQTDRLQVGNVFGFSPITINDDTDVIGNISATGQLTSTVTTGTAPLVVSSTTLVPNLYVAKAALADSSTTIPNLTGPITSVGVATAVAAQTGTGSTFVMQNTPTLTTPVIGVATGTSLDVTGTVQGSQLISDVTTGTPPLSVSSTTLVNNLYVAQAALADTSTTIPNLTGPITSTGVATAVAAQTGTGTTFVMQNTPTLTTPVIGAATGTSLDVSGALQGATVTADSVSNQIVMGTTNTTTISSTAPSASRTVTIGDAGANSYLPLSTNTGTTGHVLTSTGTNSSNWALSNGGLIQTSTKTASYTAVAGDDVLCDTNAAAGNITITLPASPTAGNRVRVTLITAHATRIVSIARNGQSIDGGTASEYELYHTLWKNGDTVTFEFVGGSTGWAAINRYIKNRFQFRGYPSGSITLNATFQTIQINTVTYDYNSSLNGSYQYVCPVTGTYQVTGSIQYTATTGLHLTVVYRNSSQLLYVLHNVASTSPSGAPCTVATGLINCSAGDTIDLRGYANGNSTHSVVDYTTYLTVHLVSRL